MRNTNPPKLNVSPRKDKPIKSAGEKTKAKSPKTQKPEITQIEKQINQSLHQKHQTDYMYKDRKQTVQLTIQTSTNRCKQSNKPITANPKSQVKQPEQLNPKAHSL